MIALVLISTMMCSCLVADKGILKLYYRCYHYRFLTGPELSQCFKVGYGHYGPVCGRLPCGSLQSMFAGHILEESIRSSVLVVLFKSSIFLLSSSCPLLREW